MDIYDYENEDGMSPLMVAVQKNKVELVREFIRNKSASLDFANDEGVTALMEGATADSYECVKLLLENGVKFRPPKQCRCPAPGRQWWRGRRQQHSLFKVADQNSRSECQG